MPPYSQNGAISAFLGVTETIEILQPQNGAISAFLGVTETIEILQPQDSAISAFLGVTETIEILQPQNGAISAFLGVTETIEILQPLINFFDEDLFTNAYLVIICEKMWYFSESKTIDVHCLGSNVSCPSSQTCIFRTYALKIRK